VWDEDMTGTGTVIKSRSKSSPTSKKISLEGKGGKGGGAHRRLRRKRNYFEPTLNGGVSIKRKEEGSVWSVEEVEAALSAEGKKGDYFVTRKSYS